MLFTIITKDLQKELKSNMPQIMILLKKQPAIAYKKIGDIGKEVGKKYDIELLVNFPHKGKIFFLGILLEPPRAAIIAIIFN